MTAHADSERFRRGAENYAAYLETPEGRLRLDLAFANLQEFLPRGIGNLRALDVGCGTGAIAIRLALLGFEVTLLDMALPMLESAERSAREAGVRDRVALKHGDASQLVDLCDPGSFDVILCHNVLEFLDHPDAVMSEVVRVMRNSSAILSLLVRNQAGEVLKAALVTGDLVTAEGAVTAEWAQEALYGGKVRLFTSDRLQSLLQGASLTVDAQRGVRVLADYLPPQISRSEDYQRIFSLERILGRRPDFAAVARYTHCIAHLANPVTKDVA